MYSPTITTKAMNVELTNERQKQIISNLAPVTRLSSERKVRCDVVIRRLRSAWGGEVFSILTRLEAGENVYYAIARGGRFSRAVSEAADKLRRRMSKHYFTESEEVRQHKARAHEKYFVELFV